MIHSSWVLLGCRSALIAGTARCSTVRSITYSRQAWASTPSPTHSRRPALGVVVAAITLSSSSSSGLRLSDVSRLRPRMARELIDRQRSGALHDHHRDVPSGPLLVAVVLREDRGHQPPQPRLLLGGGGAGPCGELVRADLQLHLRVLDQVEVPGGVLRGAAVGSHQQVAVAVRAVDQRRAPQLAGPAAAGGEQQRVLAAPLVAAPAVGLDVAADVPGDPARRAVEDLLLPPHRHLPRRSWQIVRQVNASPSRTEVPMVAFLFVLVIVALVGLALLLATRRSEQQALTFAEPVRVQRTVRWVLLKPATSEWVDDGVLRVEARSQRSWLGGEVTYRVEVPAAADVQASTGAGAVSVHGTTGEVDVRTAAGTVTLANLSGRVRATTQAGQVRGTGLGPGEVDASSSAGTVSLAFDAPPDRVEARTNAGSVELLVPDQRYAVEASSYAGTARVEVEHDPDAPRRLVAHSNAGAVRVGRR